jgi:hypothetical protein
LPAIDPPAAVRKAVFHPIVAGVDGLAGNEIGHEQVEGAAAPLLVRRQPPVPAFADPPAVDRRRMKACPAVPLGRPVAVTVVVMLAEAALPPSGIFGDA